MMCHAGVMLSSYKITHIQLRRGPPDDEQGSCSKYVEEFNKCIICE